MQLSKYDALRLAYRSRLLYRTEAEYRAALGVSFETIRDRRDDRAAVATYYNILNRECLDRCDRDLRSMMTAYVEASAICAGTDFDWGERRQLASRKKFCRWLFRRASAPGRKMSVDEESRYSPRECDHRLYDEFYPSGYEAGRVYDLIFVMLITFGVIRPCDISAGRSRDISAADVERSVSALTSLVTLLRDDTPQMGVLPKPMVFEVTLNILSRAVDELADDCTPAQLWATLNAIEQACLAVSSPQMTADSSVTPSGYSMPGIWVDDADEGRSRFWIFPENKLMAFCYEQSGCEWVMKPYEFVFYSHAGEEGFAEFCLFVTARGNEQAIDCDGVMQPSEAVSCSYDCGDDLPFDEISFSPERSEIPAWMDWRSFRRLPAGDPLHTRYSRVVADIYNPASPLSRLYRNSAPFLTDSLDSLIAIDNDYIYLSDLPAPSRFTLSLDPEGEYYRYEPVYHRRPAMNLREVEISPEHPLYILPRRCDKPTSERHRRFIEACRNTTMDSQVTIYHTRRHPGGILCFNNFSILFPLDDDLAELTRYGAVKVSHRSEL